ncbi:hypothetical protein [Endozoicomonas sp. ALB115]|uniref:hypothetical protein n=1 Tax=Endozoicomonas sp. ALB115 TaxID=3403074 RepID=UPI003BB6F895
MKILGFFQQVLFEKKLIKKHKKILALQDASYRRFKLCLKERDWCGCAADIRFILEGIVSIESSMAVENPLGTSSQLNSFSDEAYSTSSAIIDDISASLKKEEALRLEFSRQIMNETSGWKDRMVHRLTMFDPELKALLTIK